MYPVGNVEVFWALAGILFFSIAMYYIVKERQEYWRSWRNRPKQEDQM